jgi:hypothetical protein
MKAEAVRSNFFFDVVLPKVEVMAWPLAIWGLVAFFLPIVGGDTYLTTGLWCLSVVYFLRAFQPLRPNATSETNFPEKYFGKHCTQFLATSQEPSFLLDTLLPKEVGIAGAVTLIGILFKLMHWKGSTTMLIVGAGTLAVVAAVLAINQRIDERALVVLVFGSFILFTSPRNLIQQLHNNDAVLVQKMLNRYDNPSDPTAAADLKSYLRQKRAQR